MSSPSFPKQETNTSTAAPMDCANGAGTGTGEDRSKVGDFKEQILQLAGLVCREEEESSRTELLEKLSKCNKHMLVELCCSFDIAGSTANKKDELVAIVMEFLMEHCSGYPNKKFKKRRRKRDGMNLSGAKPLKKKKPDRTILGTHGEEEADGSKGEEDRTNNYEFDMKDSINECAGDKRGQFPKEEANSESFERVNGLDVVSFSEVPIATNEQVLATTPSAKLVSNVEDNNTAMKASRKKNISFTKEKATPMTDRKDKSCGKPMSRGDMKPRKHAVKPSKDELRQAVFFILDTADFATMTFGDIVKEVDKYFGKDLFERKPLIRSLIEEELFRLAEEAEKKELEEEKAAEAKARAEQAAKERAKDARFASDIDKANELQVGQNGKSQDALKNASHNSIEKGVKGGIYVKAAENRNGDAENTQEGKAEVDPNNEKNSDEFTNDGKAEKDVVNGDYGVEISGDGKTEAVKKNDNGNTIGGSEDGKTEEATDGRNGDTEEGGTEECRSGNVGNTAEDVNECEAEDFNSSRNGGNIECAEGGKGQEAGNTENGQNTVPHGAKCGKARETLRNVYTEQSPTNTGDEGKAEDVEHSGNTKVDVDSTKDGTGENGETNDAAKTNSEGVA